MGAGSIGNWLAAAVSVKLQFELLAGSNPQLQMAQGKFLATPKRQLDRQSAWRFSSLGS
jgi:hypothetical protein